MRFTIIGLAAIAIAGAAPAAAQDRSGAGWNSGGSAGANGGFTVRVHRGGGDRWNGDGRDRDGRDRDGRDGRDGRRGRDGGDTYFPYRDYQGDSLWRSVSFNDWWHDRPDRAFPRWVAGNADTCERIWSSGSGWRC